MQHADASGAKDDILFTSVEEEEEEDSGKGWDPDDVEEVSRLDFLRPIKQATFAHSLLGSPTDTLFPLTAGRRSVTVWSWSAPARQTPFADLAAFEWRSQSRRPRSSGCSTLELKRRLDLSCGLRAFSRSAIAPFWRGFSSARVLQHGSLFICKRPKRGAVRASLSSRQPAASARAIPAASSAR